MTMQAPTSRPNIVYLHSHDTGRYVAPYGHAMPTPNIQRLAEQGTLFRRAFSAAPTCSPSRAALFTGSHPHQNGMLGLTHRGFELNDGTQHLVGLLGGAGYRTVLAGLQHISTDVDRIGYDEVSTVQSHRVEHVAPAAVDFVDRGLSEPFFLDVGFFETHRPFPAPDGENPDFLAPPVPLPDTSEVRTDMAGYRRSVRTLDEGIGAVLDALEANGLSERTLVICTTDHGIAFPQMKCNLTDAGIGVMLIMRGPGGFTGGGVVDAMVSQIDLLPTVCDLAGIEPPVGLAGHPLGPLVRGETDGVHDEIFAEVSYHAAYEPQRCVRTDRWKYIRRFDHRASRVYPNCDAGPSKALLEKEGWDQQPRPDEMLYDLVFDPNETNNVIDEPYAAAQATDLRARLDRWMQDTADPLLHGPVPAPAGAKIDSADKTT
ncbi:sulfatase family protein [Microlunatus soli]|uniref:Arylsulfatase A n=1 Tax=Microlunatus soli TaxID=630515 RepID=A0A1H1ZF56_9ACTN|nr:sulfatase [Microlunatus soli]SDT31836.1 Arylsulfatase A [Microlunatus soli]